MDATEKLRRQAQDAKLVALNEAVILPYIEQQLEVHTTRLVAEFQEGKPGTHAIAMIAAYRAIRDDLRYTEKQGNRAFEKLNNMESTT